LEEESVVAQQQSPPQRSRSVASHTNSHKPKEGPRDNDSRAASPLVVSMHLDTWKTTNMDKLVQSCKCFCCKMLLQPFKPIASALSKSLTPVVFWTGFQDQTMDEDAPANVESAQAAAMKQTGIRMIGRF
jgi:hypothetical protein